MGSEHVCFSTSPELDLEQRTNFVGWEKHVCVTIRERCEVVVRDNLAGVGLSSRFRLQRRVLILPTRLSSTWA